MASALETINQLASSATKAIWGDSNTEETHKEPISGATGDVSKGEPYDAGNLDAQDQSKVASTLNSQANKSAPTGTSELADDENYALSSSKVKEQQPSSTATAPRSTAADDVPVNPEQGKPLDELTGNGPRPIEMVARENGGNAAAVTDFGVDPTASAASGAKKPESAADLMNQETKNTNTNQREATEDEYVKASGLAADGGDFDASKPGAGLEADRLMEQKGIKTDPIDSKDKPNTASSGSNNNNSHGRKSSDSNHHHKDKPSLGERIKNKLHRH
ncbi:hypothetical protein ACHAQJ_009757 [Trichoderma viride]